MVNYITARQYLNFVWSFFIILVWHHVAFKVKLFLGDDRQSCVRLIYHIDEYCSFCEQRRCWWFLYVSQVDSNW